MNQDTPVFTGTEKIARRVGATVYYLSMSRVKRGYFEGRIIKMHDDASKTEEFALTNEYFRLVSEDLKREPWLWLWTHKRWKRTREGYARREKKREEDRRRLMENASK
jgi:KDO2-lipid IV(A) lauroyltransferase